MSSNKKMESNLKKNSGTKKISIRGTKKQHIKSISEQSSEKKRKISESQTKTKKSSSSKTEDKIINNDNYEYALSAEPGENSEIFEMRRRLTLMLSNMKDNKINPVVADVIARMIINKIKYGVYYDSEKERVIDYALYALEMNNKL